MRNFLTCFLCVGPLAGPGVPERVPRQLQVFARPPTPPRKKQQQQSSNLKENLNHVGLFVFLGPHEVRRLPYGPKIAPESVQEGPRAPPPPPNGFRSARGRPKSAPEGSERRF